MSHSQKHENKLDQLFQGSPPSLKGLTLQGAPLDENSMKSICTNILPNLSWFEVDQNLPSVEDLDKNSSNLSGLRLHGKGLMGFSKQFETGNFQNLETLELEELSLFPEHLLSSLTTKKLPKLCELSLQGTSSHMLPEQFAQNEVVTKLKKLCLKRFTFTDRLSSFCLENDCLPYMETLMLVDCGLSGEDVRSLAQASVEGMLPNLRHLDLSENRQIDGSRYLFDFNCRWDNLLSLNIDCKDQQSYGGEEFSDFLHLTDKSLSGCLSSLEELKFSTQNPDCVPRVKCP